jgi:hypothetical protein
MAGRVKGRALCDGLETCQCPLGSPLKTRTVETSSPHRRKAAKVSSLQTVSFPLFFTVNRSLSLRFHPSYQLVSDETCYFLCLTSDILRATVYAFWGVAMRR